MKTDQVDAVLELVYLGSQQFGGSVSTKMTRVRRRARQVNGVDPAVHLRLRVRLQVHTLTDTRDPL